MTHGVYERDTDLESMQRKFVSSLSSVNSVFNRDGDVVYAGGVLLIDLMSH